jgi:Fe-S cluster assembly protein SufD
VDIADLPAIMPRGEHGAMAEFAIASAKAGPCLRLGKNQTGAVHLHLTEGGHGRALIVIEDGASLTLQESVLATEFSNIAVEIVIGKNARLTHVRHAPKNNAVQVVDYSVRVADGGAYRAHFANFGGKLARTEMHIALEGEGAETHLSGVGVLNDGHADVTTHVTHASGKTQSKQLFKYVASGHARGVYQGKVTVAVGANGSDSNQSAKGLLLGSRAEIDLKPELEILADDVKCAHGAAIGDLDAESLFYLRSRGIPEAEARALLMRAFIGDAVDQIEDETIRAGVWQAVDAALETLS